MHVLIAPDKFKGTMTAQEVADAIAAGITSVNANLEVSKIPMADGGEGSLDILSSLINTEEVDVVVKDPLGRSINATYLLAGESAYIEMSRASGLLLLNREEQNPLYTTTYGTGELALDAISRGAKKIYVFLGGSATNDMGIGMAEALGYEFLDRDGDRVPPVGLSLAFIMDIKRLLRYDKDQISFYAITDVDSPLYGVEGASQVFARQKGADKYAAEILEKGVRKLSRKCKKILGSDVTRMSGAGAAGGLGGGIAAFLDGDISSGIDFMMDATGYVDILSHVDLVITGEGRLDDQTAHGKVVHGIAQSAHKAGIPTIALCGQSRLTKPPKEIQRIYDLISMTGSEESAMTDSAEKLKQLAAKAFADFVG